MVAGVVAAHSASVGRIRLRLELAADAKAACERIAWCLGGLHPRFGGGPGSAYRGWRGGLSVIEVSAADQGQADAEQG